GEVMVRHVDGHTVLFVPGVYLNQGLALFRCDLAKADASVMRIGTTETSWLVDSQGRLAAEREYDKQSRHWSIKVFQDGHSRGTASGHAAIDIPEVLGFGPTMDTLLVELVEDGDAVWKLLSTSDGTFAAPMAKDRVFDAALRDPLTHRLIGGMN